MVRKLANIPSKMLNVQEEIDEMVETRLFDSLNDHCVIPHYTFRQVGVQPVCIGACQWTHPPAKQATVDICRKNCQVDKADKVHSPSYPFHA